MLIGRSVRWYNDFYEEVAFSKENGFDFIQIWFKDGNILINSLPDPKEEYIKACRFPVIIHAVFDPLDFDLYGDDLLQLLKFLNHKEVIIHPVCKRDPVSQDIEMLLADKIKLFSHKAKRQGIVYYLENNSIMDGFHCKKEELQIVFNNDDYVEQLLDVAHVDSYDHLTQVISSKFPKCLHVAGKHFSIPHEHLPITQGDIDYKLVFRKYLQGFDGRIILEVDGSDDEIIASKRIIDEAIRYAKNPL